MQEKIVWGRCWKTLGLWTLDNCWLVFSFSLYFLYLSSCLFSTQFCFLIFPFLLFPNPFLIIQWVYFFVANPFCTKAYAHEHTSHEDMLGVESFCDFPPPFYWEEGYHLKFKIIFLAGKCKNECVLQYLNPISKDSWQHTISNRNKTK